MIFSMKTARFNEAGSKVQGVQAIEIFAESKADAQEAIKVATAWIRSAGYGTKLVSFISTPRTEWSNLDIIFRARIAYRKVA
jgi:hypothetical protein